MTTKQINKLNMYLAVQSICDSNTPVWQPLPAWVGAYADLRAHIGNIQNFSQSQSVDHSGVAADKQAARQTMCATALPVAQAVHAYALKAKNNTLATTVDFSLSDLLQGRDLQSTERCQNIYAAANSNLANLGDYGITAAKLTALNTAISAYNQLVSKPRDTRAQGKTITGNLQTEFTAADDDLVLLDDLLGQLNNPKFASDFTNARIIIDIAATHETPTPPTPPPSTSKT